MTNINSLHGENVGTVGKCFWCWERIGGSFGVGEDFGCSLPR